jgi:N-acylglucosamine-6-phosphate 2-epimerase
MSIETLRHGLIVSCQAPVDSPLYEPTIIAAIAQAAVNNGAIGVRIDTPAHISAVREQVKVPIIGLWKQVIAGSDVYITPQYHHASAVAKAGADIIAIDATIRNRPGGETVNDIITRIHQELGKPVMADVDTIEAADAAVKAGADIVGTTLFGYTGATKHLSPPGWELLKQMVKLDIPAICEGGISSPQMARQALDLGAYAVVVGTAITGIDYLVKAYIKQLT